LFHPGFTMLDHPSRLCRPLRTRTGTRRRRAQARALTTSRVSCAKTITDGRWAYSRFQPAAAA
jgi:hypothetical protein